MTQMNFDDATRRATQVSSAMDYVRIAIERMARDEVTRLSELHRDTTFRFISAMGSYWVEWVSAEGTRIRSYDRHPLIKRMDDLQSGYGWGVIPAPVWIEARNGEVTIRREW